MLALFAVPASAQTARRAPTCRVDSTAEWFTRQRGWLDDSRGGWSDDTLRQRLLRATGLAAGTGVPPQAGWQLVASDSGVASMGDTLLVAQLRQRATTRGSAWPTRSVVGAAGTRAIWLLAARDTSLARAVLHRMMEAGPEESNAADVAMLEDRLRLTSGRKQLYGTQFRLDARSRIQLAPMEDSAHVDLRREDAGLPPFRLSACLAREAQDRLAPSTPKAASR
jgi:hypothetical protein